MHLSEAEHDRVSAAVTAAESGTDGEIVTVVARRSDEYHDVAAHWAVMKMIGVLAVLAAWPGIAVWVYSLFAGPWAEAPSDRAILTIALIAATCAFLLTYLAFRWRRLRLFFTPPATKARRVRRRALDLFRTAAEARTRGKTGVLIYLSLDEHRAELIADAAIHAKVEQETWGEAMAALIAGVKAGRAGDGMADAVAQVGAVLAAHFPRSADDTNELPDRLIEL
jgi:putative membrane protein